MNFLVLGSFQWSVNKSGLTRFLSLTDWRRCFKFCGKKKKKKFSSAGGMWLSRSESLWINTLPWGLKLYKLSPEQTPTQAREEGEFVRETFLCSVILCVAWLMPWFGASISGALERRRPARDILYNCSDCTKDNSIRDYTANRALTGSSRKKREEANFVFPNYSLMSFYALLLTEVWEPNNDSLVWKTTTAEINTLVVTRQWCG